VSVPGQCTDNLWFLKRHCDIFSLSNSVLSFSTRAPHSYYRWYKICTQKASLNKPRLSSFADQHDPPTEKHWLITTHATQLQEHDGYLLQKTLTHRRCRWRSMLDAFLRCRSTQACRRRLRRH